LSGGSGVSDSDDFPDEAVSISATPPAAASARAVATTGTITRDGSANSEALPLAAALFDEFVHCTTSD
jgi:hypothetical protein